MTDLTGNSDTPKDVGTAQDHRALLSLQRAVARILGSASDVDAVTTILRDICQFLGCQVGELWRLDTYHGALRCMTVWHAPDDPVLATFVAVSDKTSLAHGVGLPGRVLASGEPLWLADVSQDEDFPRRRAATAAKLRGGLAFPLRSAGRIVGIMDFFSYVPMHADETLLTVLEVVGGQIGLLLEKRQEEEARRESEARYRITADSAADAILTIDENSILRFANRAVERIFGYKPEELVGQSLGMLMPARLRGAHFAGIRRYQETGVRHMSWLGMRLPGLRKDGNEVPLEISFSEYNENGIHTFTGVARDLSHIMRLEEVYRFLSDVSAALATSLDYEETLTKISRLAVPRFAEWCIVDLVDDEGLVKRHSVMHVDPAKVELAQHLAARYPDDRAATSGVYKVLRTGESEFSQHIDPAFIVQTARDDEHLKTLQSLDLDSYIIVPMKARGRTIGTVSFVRTTAGEPYDANDLSVAEEVAARAALAVDNARLYREIRAELKVRRAKEVALAASEEQLRRFSVELEQRVKDRTLQLEAANKELEAFSYSVSHDLRAPLRSIDGFSELLLRLYVQVLDATGQDYLKRVRAASKRMSRLIDDMLGLARLSRKELHVVPVDISEMALQVADDLMSREPDRVVDVTVAPGLLGEADAELLRSVFENLIGNAWKFTQKQAHALIEVGQQTSAQGKVYFVRDNGAGFDMSYADKLFGAFQRLHQTNEYPGTGVGLASVQRIIHRHGGRVWAEGVVGQGATFYFTLGEDHSDST